MVRLVPTQSIAAARRTLEGVLVDSCTVKRQARTQGATGAVKRGTPSTIATGVPCRVEFRAETPDDTARMADAVRYQDATHNVFFRFDADVQEGDNLELANGAALEVEGVGDRQTEAFLLQAICKEIG